MICVTVVLLLICVSQRETHTMNDEHEMPHFTIQTITVSSRTADLFKASNVCLLLLSVIH